jgi:hypothetical protein
MGARCVSSARRDLCERRRAIGVPTSAPRFQPPLAPAVRRTRHWRRLRAGRGAARQRAPSVARLAAQRNAAAASPPPRPIPSRLGAPTSPRGRCRFDLHASQGDHGGGEAVPSGESRVKLLRFGCLEPSWPAVRRRLLASFSLARPDVRAAGLTLNWRCRPKCSRSARAECGRHRNDEFDARGGGGIAQAAGRDDDPDPRSPLLVRVEDVVLRLHGCVAGVSAVAGGRSAVNVSDAAS